LAISTYISLGRIQASHLVVSQAMHLSFKYDSTFLGHAFFTARLFLHGISHIFVRDSLIALWNQSYS